MDVAIRDAKARLSELIATVQSGTTVTITRHGMPVAELSRAKPKSPEADLGFFARLDAARAARGLTRDGPDLPDYFDDHAFSRQVLGLAEDDA